MGQKPTGARKKSQVSVCDDGCVDIVQICKKKSCAKLFGQPAFLRDRFHNSWTCTTEKTGPSFFVCTSLTRSSPQPYAFPRWLIIHNRYIWRRPSCPDTSTNLVQNVLNHFEHNLFLASPASCHLQVSPQTSCCQQQPTHLQPKKISFPSTWNICNWELEPSTLQILPQRAGVLCWIKLTWKLQKRR